jgi:signal transduction histidine kinase
LPRKIIPALLVALPLINALVSFTLKYTNAAVEIPLMVDIDENSSRIIFYLNFYIPFFIGRAAIYGLLFFSAFRTRFLCLVSGIFAVILGTYILNDVFTINVFIYTAYVIGLSLAFHPPKGLIAAAAAIVLFLLFTFHPILKGITPGNSHYTYPSLLEIISLLTIMLLLAINAALLRMFIDIYTYDRETIKHLKLVGNQMVVFNHRLQKLAKQRGEDAVKQERLRFTRELHDSCGYAFTNIIMVTDAAISRGQMNTADSQEIFQRLRNLASKGLNETREILHLIRQIQEPYTKSIETIYELKKIFQEVTGITVEVELGNMQYEYGLTVNQVLAKIIQEAFTNAIRHGKATRIRIQFWESSGQLSMKVTDNGIGASVIVKGIGLAGMEERLSAVGGSLTASLPPEGGFCLAITIPIVGIIQQQGK